MHIFHVILLVACAASVACLESSDWIAYKAEHGKSYASQIEESMRHAIFARNKQMIEQFNAEQSGGVGFEMGLNQFADWTEAELRGIFGVWKDEPMTRENNSWEGESYLAELLGDMSSGPLPDSLDWRDVADRVTPVKDQKKCGSSWAFAAVGLLEGQELNITQGDDLYSLSVQELLDCGQLSDTCQATGFWPSTALGVVYANGGITADDDYPYKAKQNDHCLYDVVWQNVMMTVRGPVVLPPDEKVLKTVLAKYGPVSVTFNCQYDIVKYKSGVYKSKNCSADLKAADMLQSALLVGYGTDPKEGDYWLLKNSWTEAWGEAGYIRIARNADNMCGVATLATIAAL